MKKSILISAVLAGVFVISCNNGMMGGDEGGRRRGDPVDRTKRGAIDSSAYIDFTLAENNAEKFTREQVLQVIGNRTYKNGDSWVRININEGTAEMSSSDGFFEGQRGQQFYAKFAFDIQAANQNCLYIRRDLRFPGTMMIGRRSFVNEEIPDLSICLPLYGFSANRIEVSPIMNGFIVMPSGTYWRQ